MRVRTKRVVTGEIKFYGKHYKGVNVENRGL